MSDIHIYEQPLSERFRLFLRAEQLFERLDHHLLGDSPWDTHAALQSLLELMQPLSRGDSKRELIKEIDRQRAALSDIDSRAAPERVRIDQALRNHESVLDALYKRPGALGTELKDNELLGNLQQRASAGGRPGILDLPSYQEWLQRPAAERHDTIRSWLEPVDAARTGIEQCLQLVRSSAAWATVEARDGFYEQAFDAGTHVQLLRVRMSTDGASAGFHRFPELSAGRQRFSIRFFAQSSPAERARQIHEPVTFDMACCGAV
ncbi:MAG: cell division protein ZapD [Proteobacteria bacterium SW_6_67_9]|nr:MAG: cell division protein ZapD [Proteobacteria bacterium SW_6_67_9]